MNIHNMSFVTSAVRSSQYPDTGMKEFAFAGRSNVGKSSLINKILNRKNFARVSSKPGKTATINFYNIDDTIHLVDLPGYGYASRSKDEVAQWGRMIENYLENREQLVATILLVDSRHKPTNDDCLMLEWIRNFRENVIVIATKTDKLKKHELETNLELIYKTLELSDEDILIPFSIIGEESKASVWDIINLLIEGDAKDEVCTI